MTDITGVFVLKHINLRKEGPGDVQEPAMDLKFTGKVEASLIDAMMCGEDEMKGEAERAFWREDGSPRFMGMGDVKFQRQIEHANAVIDGIQVRDVKVKNFSFSATESHTGYLTFSISSNEPPGKALATFAEMLHENAMVVITVPQGDLFADGDPKDAANRLDEAVRATGGTATLESGGKVLATFGDGPDPLYDDAKAFVIHLQRASIATLKRHLKTGYNRAARLVERMEAEGVVSPSNEKGTRRVLIAQQ